MFQVTPSLVSPFADITGNFATWDGPSGLNNQINTINNNCSGLYPKTNPSGFITTTFLIPYSTSQNLSDSGFYLQNVANSNLQNTGAALINLYYPKNTNPSGYLSNGSPIFNNFATTGLASSSGNGLMSPSDKTKLSGLPTILKNRAQTDISGSYTWIYSTPFNSGAIPIIQAVAETSILTYPINIQIVGIPNYTGCSFKVTSSPIVNIFGTNVMGLSSGQQAYIHMTAFL